MHRTEPDLSLPSGTVLPDLLVPQLDLVFCGTAPSRRSAAEQAYYAHPGNQFWTALQQAGLTPQRLQPRDYPQLLGLGIGLTDLAKYHSGNDRDLPAGAFDRDGLLARLTRYRPGVVAFTSKQAARAAMQRPRLDYGLQSETLGPCQVFVLPSPSGQARGHWDLQPWCALARYIGQRRVR